MSYCIVDNGGTKADWVVCNSVGQDIYSTETVSFNSLIKNSTLPFQLTDHLSKIDQLYFYGSGITTHQNNEITKAFLQKQCKSSCVILLQSDLLGAARATAGRAQAYVAILGTGSNFCYYSNEQIVQQKPALGYLIGDEGSGCNIGRAMIKSYLYNEMPETEKDLFESQYKLTKSSLLESLNTHKNPAQFIAHFSAIGTAINSNYFNSIIYKELNEFFKRKIYPSYQNIEAPVHFIGSISYFYSHLIKKLCLTHKINMGQIIQKPITGLINYHNE